jgi:hypothetical protein
MLTDPLIEMNGPQVLYLSLVVQVHKGPKEPLRDPHIVRFETAAAVAWKGRCQLFDRETGINPGRLFAEIQHELMELPEYGVLIWA